ncbi:MAG: histidinol-phosphatase [Clostridia bacterium]|nr:histidinol-phosphatase [Clostridia bacterium]
MDYNFHTHTKRCRHATGNDEDYIKCAIEAGIKHLGFSDHAPFIFPDGFENRYRIPMSEGESYISDLKILREKYRNQIEIKIGFEMEYYPKYFNEMLDIARKLEAEYLILGQHFILSEYPNGIGAGGPTDNSEYLKIYVDEVIEAMKTGVFSYVAHPDVMCFTGNDLVYESEITRLCLASRKLDIPLEINLAGVRYNKFYPAEKFWKIAGIVGAPVTIGYDAHRAKDLLNTEQLISAESLMNRYNLNYIGIPKLKPIW